MGMRKEAKIISKLAFYRRKMNLSQQQLADKLNLTRRQIQYYELYSKTIPLELALKFSVFFKIKPENLLNE
ncbi:MAG: hypothetical protein ACD_79C01472G0001 [uncultured bacterium]|nr:MAG: hypothetical protein ACD_79C01472G0001 [uncultured bacterium]